MKKLYDKNQLWFALVCIIAYCVMQSSANSLNAAIGIDGFFNAVFNIILGIFLFGFIYKNGLLESYGFCKPKAEAWRFLWYIPLVVFASRNLWFGISADNYSTSALVCNVLYMFMVGVVEEILFRGLLFNAIAKDSIRQAVIISSVTFGLGHILHLIDGSGTELIPNLCQVVYAVAVGFLFVIIYYRGGSIIPCILTHSAIDVASVFSNESAFRTEAGLNNTKYILFALSGIAFALVYTLVLIKTLPDNGIKFTTAKENSN